MKKNLTLLISTAFILGMAIDTVAGVKKSQLRKGAVEEQLEKAGEAHFPSKMRLGKVGSVKSGNTYFHVWKGKVNGKFRVIIFDNTPEYLGYYETEYEPSEYKESTVLFDSGESDEFGNTDWIELPVLQVGPLDVVSFRGTPSRFIRVPVPKEENNSTEEIDGSRTAGVSEEDAGFKYREWNLTLGGKVRTYNAVFVKVKAGKVYIKDSKRGKIAQVPASALSAEDREYVKQVIAGMKK